MADTLFPELDEEPTLSVTELNAQVRSSLARAFPREVWVRGEVQRLSQPASGHVYFTLAEQRGGQTAAAMPVTLLSREKRRIDRELAGLPVELVNGAEVRIRAKVTVYVPRGQLQLEMTGLDPYFSIGRIAAKRARVLAELAAEGLVERNRTVPLPAVPLRIALVTSIDSAAYHDFVHELEVSTLGFRVAVFDARVQGQEAPRSIAVALRAAVRHRPDVVVVARGGGAQHDLAAFDHEAVARVIALAPVPVIVGVGHQVDRSVADEVAHTSCKTPTACAQLLVARVHEAHDRVEAAWTAIVTAARAATRERAHANDVTRDRVRQRTLQHVTVAEHRVEHVAAAVVRASDTALRRQRERLDDRRARVAERTRTRLDRAELTNAHRTDRLVRAARRPFEPALRQLATLDTRVRDLDPARVLARGYSITRTAAGHAVRDAATLTPGVELHTRLAAGTVVSRVESTEPEEPTPP